LNKKARESLLKEKELEREKRKNDVDSIGFRSNKKLLSINGNTNNPKQLKKIQIHKRSVTMANDEYDYKPDLGNIQLQL